MSREPIRIRQGFQTNKMSYLLLWEIRRRFHRLCPRYGQVAHALRTLPPVAVRDIATSTLPLDLHVLSLPLAFILSQDQTLLCIFFYFSKLVPTLCNFQRNQRSRFICSRYFVVLSFSLFKDLLMKIPLVVRTGLQR